MSWLENEIWVCHGSQNSVVSWWFLTTLEEPSESLLFTSQRRWKRRHRNVPSLHRSAMEKTREYELIWTVEPGVSALSSVLRRDGGVEVVASDAECVGKIEVVGLRLEQRCCVKPVGPADVGVARSAAVLVAVRFPKVWCLYQTLWRHRI